MKKMLPQKRINVFLFVLLLLSLYTVIAISFWPSIRIPILCNAVDWKSINDVLLRLSLSFICAYVFWQLTVRFKYRAQRDTYKWWLHDQITSLNSSLQNVLTEIGYDKAYSEEDVRQFFSEGEGSENNFNSFIIGISTIDNLTLQVLNLNLPWNEDELTLFGAIHNTCHDIIDQTNYEVKEENVTTLFNQITQLNKLSIRLDKMGSLNT